MSDLDNVAMDRSYLTESYCRILRVMYGGKLTGSRVIGSPSFASDFDVFCPLSSSLVNWLEKNEFSTRKSIDDVERNCSYPPTIASYRHPGCDVNVIACHPDYYPKFNYADQMAKMLAEHSPESVETRDQRVKEFKRFLDEWAKIHNAGQLETAR